MAADATVYVLITVYHLVRILGDEAISCYADVMITMQKRLAAVGKAAEETYKI